MVKALVLLMPFGLLAAPPTVKVRQGAAVVPLPLERYVASVLAGESSVFRSDEALKAMAVAARTYAVRLRGRHAAEGFDFCSTTHCQRIDLKAITPRLEAIVDDTAGELLWWEGKPAFACYTRDCGGHSEDAGALWPDVAAPYLRGREDPWCRGAATRWQWIADPVALASALQKSGLKSPGRVEEVKITKQSQFGRAQILVLEGPGGPVRISAGSFRFAVGRELGWNTMLSDQYQVAGLRFEGVGAGHGAGLCQLGADRMGMAGHSYREILADYYPGTQVGLTARGLTWQRLAGEHVVLFTVRPDQDRAVLEIAERIAEQTGGLSRVTLRVYPDLDTFRNATGEPGTVAGFTQGQWIHLQPANVLRSRGILESTIRHEMLHVMGVPEDQMPTAVRRPGNRR